MSSKLQILDTISELEDQLMIKYNALMEKEVYQKINEIYGKEGVKICDIYYHGDNETAVETKCDDCAAKAQRLIEIINITNKIVDEIVNDSNSQFAVISEKINFDELIQQFIESICNVCNSKGISINKQFVVNLILFQLIQKQKTNQEQ